MTTSYFAELTGHTIEEAETLLRWANVPLSVIYEHGLNGKSFTYWKYPDATSLIMFVHDQTIEAIRAGSDKIK